MIVPALLALTAAAADAQPNVLLILVDDLGYSDLGCYGGEIPTPHLDRIAAHGARFTQFYGSARCCPSRASLLTGQHPHTAGIGSFTEREPKRGGGPAYAGRLLESTATLAECLSAAGYSTSIVGKWHLGEPGPLDRGFDRYYGFRDLFAYSAGQWNPREYVLQPEDAPRPAASDETFYATDAFTDHALSFLHATEAEDDRPWFLYLAHSSPHFPVQAPLASIECHVDRYRAGWDTLRAARLERMKALGLVDADAELPPRELVPVDGEKIANGFPGEPNPAWGSLSEERREDLAWRMATYAAMVEHVDRGVGEILAQLEADGELGNTLILFTSDNGACYEWGPFGFDGPSRRGTTELRTGDALKNTGQRGTWTSYGSGWANLCNTPLAMYKHFCHEGGLASPLLVHWPAGLEAAGWVERPSHLMDVLPTVLEAAGAEYPAQVGERAIAPFEGRSLLAACRGEEQPARTLCFEHQGARAVRDGRWKAVYTKREPGGARWKLFDVEADRFEQNDLSEEHPERLAQLIAQWEAWARRVGAEPFPLPDLERDPWSGV